jgi:hypothetical protein
MSTLSDLGIKKNWTYEVIITCYNGEKPHSAPFGIKSPDMKTVRLEMYKGSNTLNFILKRKEFVINFVDEIVYYFLPLFKKDQIVYLESTIIDAPVLGDASSVLGARMSNSTEKKQTFLIDADIVDIRIRNKPKLFNRAEGLVMESLITATRFKYLPEGKAEEMLKENCRVVKKVAPNSSFADIMEKLLNRCEIFV